MPKTGLALSSCESADSEDGNADCHAVMPSSINAAVPTSNDCHGTTSTGTTMSHGPSTGTDVSGSSAGTTISVLRARTAEALSFSDDERELLRGISMNHLLRCGALVLSNNTGSASSYNLSKPLPTLDVFLSHNWSVSRFRKFSLVRRRSPQPQIST